MSIQGAWLGVFDFFAESPIVVEPSRGSSRALANCSVSPMPSSNCRSGKSPASPVSWVLLQWAGSWTNSMRLRRFGQMRCMTHSLVREHYGHPRIVSRGESLVNCFQQRRGIIKRRWLTRLETGVERARQIHGSWCTSGGGRKIHSPQRTIGP